MNKVIVIFSFLLSLQILAKSQMRNLIGNWKKETQTQKIVAPFGFKSRQPPSDATVQILNHKVGLKAQQVCGHTDWTTTQIYLPKQLLTKQYWVNVGKDLIQKAQSTVMDMAGALPSMIACNISPTYCNVFNQAERMAGLEADLTFNTCQILEGVANTEGLQSTKLRDCIRRVHQQSGDKNYTDSEAREKCLTGDKANRVATKDKIAGLEDSPNGLDLGKLFLDLFPDREKGKDQITENYTQGHHLYSRRTQSKKFFKDVYLKGIGLKGQGFTVVAGTFQGVEEKKDSKVKEIKNEVVRILKKMNKLSKEGYAGVDVIDKSKYLWENKDNWKKNKKPSPIYRPVNGKGDPTFLISPEQIYMLLPFVKDEKEDQHLAVNEKNDIISDDLHQIIDRLSEVSASIATTDLITDSYNSLKKKCDTSPDYKSAEKQVFCKDRLEKIKSDFDFIYKKSLLEERAFNAQMQVRNYANGMLQEMSNKVVPLNRPKNHSSGKPLLIPGTY